MKVEKDISGFDAVDKWEGDLWDAVADIGLNAVQFAKENGEYKNHTHNLRNAPGYAVVKDGKIIKMEVPADGNHAEARKETEDFINNGEKPQNGLILADGMPYASFVESKGFNVLSGAALHAEAKFNDKLK
jgi:Fe-S cluster assembly scaffold protein SufB|nr:MAG TPA: hypothetical protein [Caudoviricetes sp.]